MLIYILFIYRHCIKNEHLLNKLLCLFSMDERKSHGFGTTWANVLILNYSFKHKGRTVQWSVIKTLPCFWTLFSLYWILKKSTLCWRISHASFITQCLATNAVTGRQHWTLSQEIKQESVNGAHLLYSARQIKITSHYKNTFLWKTVDSREICSSFRVSALDVMNVLVHIISI